MSGRVAHFEIPFDDGERARSFYRSVFGWEVEEVAEMDYTFVQTGPHNDEGYATEPGYIGGGMFQRQAPIATPVLTIEVDDIAAAMAAVVANGGAVVSEPSAVGEMGIAGYFTDSEGNLMGVWQSL